MSNPIIQDVAVCFSTNGEIITIAAFDQQGEIVTKNFAVESGNFFPAFKMWRDSLSQKTDLQTVFRIVPVNFTEQTKVVSLPEETFQLDDKELTAWLVNAAKSDFAGIDGQLLFESSLDRSAYDYVRLPSGGIALTELPQERLSEAVKRLMQIEPLDSNDVSRLTQYAPDDEQPFLLHAVETPLRAMMRYLYLVEKDFFASLERNESVAVFAFTPQGCGYALWNPDQLFFAEIGEWFNFNFDESEIPPEMDVVEYVANLYTDSTANFLHEQFHRRIMPEDEETPPVSVKRIFWSATDGLETPLTPVFNEFAESTNLIHTPVLQAKMEEMIVRGLLLCFDEQCDKAVPSVNLANDITVQNSRADVEKQNVEAVAQVVRRRKAFVALLLPLLIVAGLILGLRVNNSRVSYALSRREKTAQAEQNRLKPILEARSNYEKTLKWYEDVLRQIVALRGKQTSALAFAARLDPLYPTSGSAFYINEMKLLPGGAFEIKGLTKNELEVSEFVRALEFSEDDKKARYFTNLQLDFKQGSRFTSASGQNNSSLGGGAISNLSGNLADGVSMFFLKGNFAPASVLKAQSNVPQQTPPTPPQPSGANTTNTMQNSATQQSVNPANSTSNTGANK